MTKLKTKQKQIEIAFFKTKKKINYYNKKIAKNGKKLCEILNVLNILINIVVFNLAL